METVKESIDVGVPVSTAYNQWTQFEEFPTFMEGVESVGQIDDTHLRWVAEVGGERREWRAEIVEQVPDEKLAWRAVEVNGPNGIVTFEPLGEEKTLITVEMSYEPEGLKESRREDRPGQPTGSGGPRAVQAGRRGARPGDGGLARRGPLRPEAQLT